MRVDNIKFLKKDEICDKLNAGEYNDIIISFLPLVVCVSNRMKRADYELQEIMSAGYMGLIKGVYKLKEDKIDGVTTYLYKCISNEIIKFYKYEDFHNSIYHYDDDISDDVDVSFLGLIEDDFRVEDFILQEELKSVVLDALDCLSENNRHIIEKRYGIGCEPMIQKDLCAELNMKRSTLAMKERRILDNLKKIIRRNNKEYVV